MEHRFFGRQPDSSLSSPVWVVSNGGRLLLARSDETSFRGGRRLLEVIGHATSPASNSNSSDQGSTPGPAGFQTLDPNVVIIMVVLFFALICAALVNSLMRCVLRRRAQAANARAVFVGRGGPGEDNSEQGLDATTLASLPVLTFKPSEDSKTADVDCTICLSEFTENERLRLLPKCSHVFHLDCIDMWLLSHSSCPVCRDGIKADEFPPKIMSDQDDESGEMMILTLDQDGHPSVIARRSTGSGGAGGATESGESANVNVKGQLKRDKSWHSLSDAARLSSSMRSISVGTLGSFRDGSISGRIGSSRRSSFRTAISNILTSGDKNSSARWPASSSSVPPATSAAASSAVRSPTKSSTAEWPEGEGRGVVELGSREAAAQPMLSHDLPLSSCPPSTSGDARKT